MDSRILHLQRDDLEPLAEAYFSRKCRCGRKSAAGEQAFQHGLALRERIEIAPCAAYGIFKPLWVEEDTVRLGGVAFRTPLFSRLPQNEIDGVAAYVLTAGNPVAPADNPLDLFYADAWGTAYVDAARNNLRERIAEIAGVPEPCVSDSIAPGFYGMPMEEMASFFELLRPETCGITLSARQHIMPPKSCAGLFVCSQSMPIRLPSGCLSCLGNKKNCAYCQNAI